MANLPQRPIFTNLGDGSPKYRNRRLSSSCRSGSPARKSPRSRQYHPYNRRPSAPAGRSSTRPWRLRQTPSYGYPNTFTAAADVHPGRSHVTNIRGYPATTGAMSLLCPRLRPSAPQFPSAAVPIIGTGWDMAAYGSTGHGYSTPAAAAPDLLRRRESASGRSSPMSVTMPPRDSHPARTPNIIGLQASDAMSLVSSTDQGQHLPSPESMDCSGFTRNSAQNTVQHHNENDRAQGSATGPTGEPPLFSAPFAMNDRSLLFNLSAAADRPSHFPNPPSCISVDEAGKDQSSNDMVMRSPVGSDDTVRQNRHFHSRPGNEPRARIQPIALAAEPTTTLHLTLHNTTRTLLIDSSVLRVFTALRLPSSPYSPPPASYTMDLTPTTTATTGTTTAAAAAAPTRPTPSRPPHSFSFSTSSPSFSSPQNPFSFSPPTEFPSSLSPRTTTPPSSANTLIPPSAAPSIPSAALTCPSLHLDALQSFLAALHDHAENHPEEEDHAEDGPEDNTVIAAALDVDAVWRLGAMDAKLGIGAPWVEWLRRKVMWEFVRETEGVVGGGLGGARLGTGMKSEWGGIGNGGTNGEGEGGSVGRTARELGRWEKALGACLAFGWAVEFRVLAARLAYLCEVGEDPDTGEVRLVKPDGKWVEAGICGNRVVGIILAARRQILPQLFATAQQLLRNWTVRIGNRPCENIHCVTNRIAALNVFLLQSGLFPRTRLDKSLLELVLALKHITATDAELAAAAQTQGFEEYAERKLGWANSIRRGYGMTCTKCHERAATSALFPLEDLLADLTWELHDRLVEATYFPHPPICPCVVDHPLGRGV
ncbi:hypothetical protein VTK26DRAFT_7183 [Humicola hyalothermophila]